MYKVINETKDTRMTKTQGGLDFILSLICSALILITVSTLFSRFMIEDTKTALIAAFLIAILNKTIKPILFFMTLPVTIVTLGLFYPLVNGIILNIVDWALGANFVISGFWTVFFASVLISIFNMLVTSLVLDKLNKGGY